MRKTVVAALIVAAMAGTGVALAQSYGPGMMGGYGGGYGPGMMGGYGGGYGPGMMGGYGGGYGPGMMGGYGGGYGPRMMGGYHSGYGPGWMHGQAWGGRDLKLSTGDVKNYLEQTIRNPRLKVGEVKETDADTITATIVTKDKDAVVQSFSVNRHNGFWRPEGE